MSTCSKNVNRPCENEAVEILCARSLWGEWETYPRCAEHPAAEDETMLKRASPSVATIVIPADAEAGMSLFGEMMPAVLDVFAPAAEPVDTEADR